MIQLLTKKKSSPSLLFKIWVQTSGELMRRRSEEEVMSNSCVEQDQLPGFGPAPDSTLPQELQLSHLWKNKVWSSFSQFNRAAHLKGLSNYITPTLSYLVFHHACVAVEFFGSHMLHEGYEAYETLFHNNLHLLSTVVYGRICTRCVMSVSMSGHTLELLWYKG